MHRGRSLFLRWLKRGRCVGSDRGDLTFRQKGWGPRIAQCGLEPTTEDASGTTREGQGEGSQMTRWGESGSFNI